MEIIWIQISVSINKMLLEHNHACLLLSIAAFMGFPGGSMVRNLPAMQEMQEIQVQSLVQEDPLEEGLATHFNILAWRTQWIEEPGGLQSMESQRVGHVWCDWACSHSCPQLPSCYKDRAVIVWQRLYNFQSLSYLLSHPLKKKFVDLWCRSSVLFNLDEILFK